MEKIPHRKILVVDDDENVQILIKRAFLDTEVDIHSALNSKKAVQLAQEEIPDLIILDICMPEMDGKEVLKELRRNRVTQMIPVMMLTGSGMLVDKIVGFELGADDYVTKPFEMDELRIRVQSLFRRTARDLSANPLTRLPGNPAIENAVAERIRLNSPFAFFYIDIDNFKAFNDVYGYPKGDVVIQETAAILVDILKSLGKPDDFLGHVGGDDFAVITHPSVANSTASAIAHEFDRQTPLYYTEEDKTNGYITAKNRLGIERRFPLMTISIAIATTENRSLTHYAKVVDIVSEIKRYLKSNPDRHGSLYLIDRRSDSPPLAFQIDNVIEKRIVP
jgi:diguanylate cyclase (GGDEF)-like protein